MSELKLRPLARYNTERLNNHQVAMRGQVSYPTAVKYMRNEIEEPQLLFVIRILDGMGIDWKEITLGELVDNGSGEGIDE